MKGRKLDGTAAPNSSANCTDSAMGYEFSSMELACGHIPDPRPVQRGGYVGGGPITLMNDTERR